VSSSDLEPKWIPFISTKVAEDILVFSLNLMVCISFLYIFISSFLTMIACFFFF